jgi:enamine deaminase RidA (YjgF/YER057c/UK114 family)
MKRKFSNRAILVFALAAPAASGAAHAQDFRVTRIPAPGGEVVFANPGEREEMYDQLTYAAARRAGDFVFLSGVEAGPLKGEGTDPEAHKGQLRRAFKAINASLVASGASFSQVVQLQTFHNCKTANFKGDFNAQLEAMLAVKAEFMKPPYSTWTAVCIDRHYSDNTVVEIQVTAYAPTTKPRR